MSWQSRFGGREWMVTTYGVLSRDPETGEEEAHRTDGQPLTVTRYLYHWGQTIHLISREEKVPVDIVLATLATENGAAKIVNGKPYVRPVAKEPGYVSDDKTPHRISVGPCHVLISTARAAMDDKSIDRAWLEDLENNMRASFRALRHKDERSGHGYDPVLAAACYNSGGIYDASSPRSKYHNRWHLRSYGNHLDRFANWFGDARYVLTDAVAEPEEDVDLPPVEPPLIIPPRLAPPRLMPLPDSARLPTEAITPEILRRELEREGFSEEDIGRIGRAMERVHDAAEQAVEWYHRARPVLRDIVEAWRVLRG